VPSARPPLELERPPNDFDELVEWFDRISKALVLLEEIPLPAVRRAVSAIADGVTSHCESRRDPDLRRSQGGPDAARHSHVLRADHDRFATSVQQLWWFYGVVEREDHGGNRQALGQYGRLLSEALRQHRVEERPGPGFGRRGDSRTIDPPARE